MKKTVLVVGGAGYIGSHTAYLLAQAGFQVIILDNLLHGQESPVFGDFIQADFADPQILKHIFSTYNIHAVMHFAAFIEVGLSVIKPAEFYHNNVTKTIQLLDIMREYNVNNFIFSSSCAVYGVPQKLPLTEEHSFAPINPYGKNKLIIEYVLQDYAHAYGLKYISLRYFNAAGALPEFGLGEIHKPETHVIPLLLRAARDNKNFTIFGDDYPTHDGTCVRDYVHVLDIAQAHVLAFEYLEKTGDYLERMSAFNLGSETGYTVKELVTHVQEITGFTIPVRIELKRAGDVPVLVANATKAKSILGWKPVHSDIKNILQSAWAWEIGHDMGIVCERVCAIKEAKKERMV